MIGRILPAVSEPRPQRAASLARLTSEGLSRYGVAGCVERLARVAGNRLRELPGVAECHIWYVLELPAGRRALSLPVGFECARAGMDALALLGEFETLGMLEARHRLASGAAQLWLARVAGEVASICWIFRGRTPVRAVPGGWLSLPADVVCIEDVVTANQYRGLGLAPATWVLVAEAQARTGVRAVISKVETDNVSSRRAFLKAGFRPVASMTFERLWWARRVTLEPEDEQRCPRFLLEQIHS